MTAPRSAAEFWSLVAQSQLISAEQCLKLASEFAATGGDSAPTSVGDWLVERNFLSAFQSQALLAGHVGPFHYGDYVVYDRIDAGRFAGRFRAAHSATRHPVVLEFLTSEQAADAAFMQELHDRANLAKQIRSPHVQRLFEFVETGPYKFLVIEDLSGASVVEMLRGKMACSASEAVRYTRWAALGLKDWIAAGLVHNAIASRNLWFEPAGNIKLIVSVATLMGATRFAANDAILLDYRAPELNSPAAEPNERSDIYALGALMHELATGKTPFAGLPHDQKAQAHITTPFPSPGANPNLAQLAKVIARAAAKNPADRIATADDFAALLTKMLKPERLAPTISEPPATLAAFEEAITPKPVSAKPAVAAAPIAGPKITPVVISVPAQIGPSIAPLINAERKSVASRVTERRKSSGGGWLIGLSLASFLLIGGGVTAYLLGYFGPPKAVPTNGDGGSVTTTSANGGENPTATNIVADNGEILWASPTQGGPIDLANIPPGPQIFVHLRPAKLLESAEGKRALQSLGPNFEAWKKSWETSAGATWEEIDSLLVAFVDVESQPPRPYYVVTLKAKAVPDALLTKWGNPEKKKQDKAEYFVASDRAFLIFDGAQTQFAMGAEADIVEAASAPGLPPPLRREMEQLRKSSDGDRSLSVLFAPGYLFTDGRELLSGPLARVREPLQVLLGDGLQGGLLSINVDQDTYLELRLVGISEKPKNLIAAEIKERIEKLPSELESYIDRIAENPHWSRLRRQFPAMVKFLGSNTRVGAEENQAIVNCYLPAAAAHNLIAATELTLASQPGAAAVATASNTPSGPKTIEEVLNYKFTLEIPQQDLINALADVQKSVVDGNPNLPFPFKITFGEGLQTEGITRNQPIRNFKMENASTAEILTGLVMKANPTTEKAPSEKTQKLVWIIGPDPSDPSKQAILITTRAAVEKAKLKLPAVFELKM
jgi:eukaryotic-like serine/threonine-protein kinase